MAAAVAELSLEAAKPAAEPGTRIGVLIVCERPLLRVGLRAFLSMQRDFELLGEAAIQQDVLLLARERRPDIALLDGGLPSADPLHLVPQLRQLGVRVLVFAPAAGDEETLFRFLMYGAAAYEDPYLSGEELLAKMRRVAQGECLVTGDVLLAQAARRERLAHVRRAALRTAQLAEVSSSSPSVGDCKGEDCTLSQRERAILEQIAGGRTNTQVAQALGVGPHIVKNCLDQLFKKLNIHDRTTAVVIALRHQWITLDSIHSLSL